MYQERQLLYLYCETPLHAGSGSDLGIVDLPIQREQHTSHPKIEASSLKGALREHFCRLGTGEKDEQVQRTFGPDPDSDDANKYAGCIAFTDARLLCFPIRSAAGVWTWITCPSVLARFAQDLDIELPNITVDTGKAVVAGNDVVISGTEKIVFEEFAFTKTQNNDVVKIAKHIAPIIFPKGGAFHDKLMGNLVVLNDEDFAYFAENATEVITRIRISQATGTVEKGALWTEEYLPSESILYTVVLASPEFRIQESPMKATEVMTYLKDTLIEQSRFQLGGNATLGKGHLIATFAKTQND